MTEVRRALKGYRGRVNARAAEEILSSLHLNWLEKLERCAPGPERELLAELVEAVLLLAGAGVESDRENTCFDPNDGRLAR